MSDREPAYLILHGWENHRPEGHWQYELARDLRERGLRVEYPQLPDADHPTVEAWTQALHDHLHDLDGHAVTIVCHSLSTLLWLGARPHDAVVERVLLVAPPAPDVVAGFDAIAAFADLPRPPHTPGDPPTLIVAGDDDPLNPAGAEAAFGVPLRLPVTVIPRGGHLALDAGYGHWPSVTAWCLDPSAPITPR